MLHDALPELIERVKHAHSTREPLRIVGGGTWLDAGRPCTGAHLPIGTHRGVIEYTPGDLTITVRAGTTLRELHTLTSEYGQWLGLDPAHAPEATIGATIATASDGPLSTSLGRVRDLVLGLECISGAGERVRAGGQVVKNVAGFDLVRLHTGAWGTLGVISEVTMRLRARPETDRTFVIAFDERAALEAVMAPLVNLAIAPLSFEMMNGPLAQRLGVHDRACLLVRLGGNSARVEGQLAALAQLGDVAEVSWDVFDQLQSVEPEAAIVAQVSHMPTLITSTWRHVLERCATHGIWQPQIRASLSRGMVRIAVPNDEVNAMPDDTLAEFVGRLAPLGAHVTWERLPTQAWPHVRSSVDDRLSVALRRTLDPSHVLNRGLLGEPFFPTPDAVEVTS